MFWQHRLEHLHATLLLFIAWARPRVDVSWLGHLLGVLSEAKSLNAVKGQKVAGSSPVRPTKHQFSHYFQSCLKNQTVKLRQQVFQVVFKGFT